MVEITISMILGNIKEFGILLFFLNMTNAVWKYGLESNEVHVTHDVQKYCLELTIKSMHNSEKLKNKNTMQKKTRKQGRD